MGNDTGGIVGVASRPILSGLAVAVLLGWLAAGPLSRAAAVDDVAAADGEAAPEQDEPAGDAMQRLLALQARHVVLGWREGRIELDPYAMRANALGPDFDRHRAAVQAVVEKAPKLLADEAVAKGLPRDVAEKVFDAKTGFGREGTERQWPFDREFDAQQTRMLFEEDVGPYQLLLHAYRQAEDRGIFQDRWTGSSMSGGNDELTINRENFAFTFANKAAGLRYRVSHAGKQSRSMSLTIDGPELTIVWEAAADADGAGEETVRIRQGADRFRLVQIRDDETTMKLDGGSFRDCCRASPDVVRRELPPLLRRIGVGPPAMPDDESVQAEVMTRLRRALGRPPQAVVDTDITAAKHRITQASAAIEAFQLLDDAAYLGGLKAKATGDDAAAIESRLEALAAGRK